MLITDFLQLFLEVALITDGYIVGPKTGISDVTASCSQASVPFESIKTHEIYLKLELKTVSNMSS